MQAGRLRDSGGCFFGASCTHASNSFRGMNRSEALLMQ
jgi:hypothetical protein